MGSFLRARAHEVRGARTEDIVLVFDVGQAVSRTPGIVSRRSYASGHHPCVLQRRAALSEDIIERSHPELSDADVRRRNSRATGEARSNWDSCGAAAATPKPDYTSLQVQTSVSTLPIPIVWGQNKIAPNLIWYDNFQRGGRFWRRQGGPAARAARSGGAMVAPSSNYTYTADIIMALCEGPLTPLGPFSDGIGYIWKDLSIYFDESRLGLGIFNVGATPQARMVISHAETYPYNALAYQGTAYAWPAPVIILATRATIGNHNFEVFGPLAGSGGQWRTDADPALVIQDFLINAQYGCGLQFGHRSICSARCSPMRTPGAGLLQGDGLRLLSGPDQPRAGVEHLDPLAAVAHRCGRLEWRPTQVHSLRRHCDRPRP